MRNVRIAQVKCLKYTKVDWASDIRGISVDSARPESSAEDWFRIMKIQGEIYDREIALGIAFHG